MAHTHSHDHSHSHHHHDHAPKITHLTRAFVIGIFLNAAFVVAEFVFGLLTHSLSLLTDAGHNLSDVASLALALLAFKLSGVAKNNQYTYGYKRSTIIVSLLNAIILLAAVVIIAYQAVNRLMHPEPIAGSTIAWVAAAGILVNGITAWLFVKGKEDDLNVKGAYLHMAVDAVVSFGVVISGLIIYFTHWFWVDSMVSLIIVVVIVGGTWSLLKESLRLALDGIPKELDLEKVKNAMLKTAGVRDVHHIHIWALSTTENALTAHVVIDPSAVNSFNQIKEALRHELLHLDIRHSTFEPEFSVESCSNQEC